MEAIKKFACYDHVRDKQATMRKLIDAVGYIIRTKGYTGLGVNKIARQAGVDKVLVYRYFTSCEQLIETYVREKEYWRVFSEKLIKPATDDNNDLKEIVTSILQNQFDFFFKEKEMQQLILWGISEKGELRRRIAQARESLFSDLLKRTDTYFKGSRINFRILSALLSSGIYYMVLHKDVGEYCGIDLKKEADREELKHTMKEVMALVFDERDRIKES